MTKPNLKLIKQKSLTVEDVKTCLTHEARCECDLCLRVVQLGNEIRAALRTHPQPS